MLMVLDRISVAVDSLNIKRTPPRNRRLYCIFAVLYAKRKSKPVQAINCWCFGDAGFEFELSDWRIRYTVLHEKNMRCAKVGAKQFRIAAMFRPLQHNAIYLTEEENQPFQKMEVSNFHLRIHKTYISIRVYTDKENISFNISRNLEN